MKNKIFSRLALAFMCFTLIGVLSVSCNKDDDESDKVELYSFGPCPVLRGNDIHFIGENLNKITSIVLPSNLDITDITVISSSEISVTVPQEAEEGYVVLNHKGGTITTQTLLGFTEPYVITSISPIDQAIREGNEVTITGDYLNNITSIVFSGNASVDAESFISQTRKQIVVAVPKEATSGKIIVEDEAGNQLYSDQELIISQPIFTSFTSSVIKAGNNLTIQGQNFDLIESVVFAGGTSVAVADFVSMNATSIVVATPANIQDGAITLIAYSGVEVVSSANITTVVPTSLVISAETRYKAGLNAILSGSDLDLVTSVVFNGADAITDFAYAQAGTITIAIPNAAIDGEITLNLASGKTVVTSAITLVKPVVTSLGASDMISGNNLTINGTDLDLVTSVSIGEETVTVSDQSATSITVFVPEAISGSGVSIALTNINGTVADAASINITETTLAYITKMESSCGPGATLTIQGRNFNNLTGITLGDKTCEYAVNASGTTLFLLVPSNVSIGSLDLVLTTAEGSVKVVLSIVNSGPDPILATTIMVIDYEKHGDHDGSWDLGWAGNTELITEDDNSYLRVTGSVNGWIINCNHQANGAPAPIIENIENYVLKLDVKIEDGVTAAEAAELQIVLADSWKWYGAGLLPSSTGGEWMTISVPVSTWGLTGTLDLSSGTNGLAGGPVPAGVSFDNLRFDLK